MTAALHPVQADIYSCWIMNVAARPLLEAYAFARPVHHIDTVGLQCCGVATSLPQQRSLMRRTILSCLHFDREFGMTESRQFHAHFIAVKSVILSIINANLSRLPSRRRHSTVILFAAARESSAGVQKADILISALIYKSLDTQQSSQMIQHQSCSGF